MNNLDDKILMIENKIDDVDRKMVELLEKRLKLSGEEALLKKERGMPVPDLVRVRTKTEKLVADAREDMAHYRKLCYMALNELTYDYQRRVTLPESEIYKSVKNALEQGFKSFPEKAVVACQGVQGAYQQKACDKLFSMPKIIYMKNFNGVFAAVDKGLCRYGVLPLENSTAGSVNSVYDLLSKYKCYIVRSVRLKIDHSLLAKKGTKIEDIKEIFSHEQAILQCEDYLKNFTDAKVTVCSNTAEAAELVAKSERNDVAALASYECIELYGLSCLEESVQDNGNNYTRFICISKELEIYPGAGKTSLMFTASHKPGSLYNILARFYALDINIQKIESRAIPNRDFIYRFYFDIEADIYSEKFANLMNQVEELSKDMCYLGSYVEV